MKPTTQWYGLMVGVLVLHPERSNSSDSLSKTHVVHVVLSIVITWREVDELTPETPFFIQPKKQKTKTNKTNITLGDSTTQKLITNLKFVQTKKKMFMAFFLFLFFYMLRIGPWRPILWDKYDKTRHKTLLRTKRGPR